MDGRKNNLYNFSMTQGVTRVQLDITLVSGDKKVKLPTSTIELEFPAVLQDDSHQPPHDPYQPRQDPYAIPHDPYQPRQDEPEPKKPEEEEGSLPKFPHSPHDQEIRYSYGDPKYYRWIPWPA